MNKDEPTQRTEKGAEIPVPKRGDFMRVVKKAAQPADEPTDEQIARAVERALVDDELDD